MPSILKDNLVAVLVHACARTWRFSRQAALGVGLVVGCLTLVIHSHLAPGGTPLSLAAFTSVALAEAVIVVVVFLWNLGLARRRLVGEQPRFVGKVLPGVGAARPDHEVRGLRGHLYLTLQCDSGFGNKPPALTCEVFFAPGGGRMGPGRYESRSSALDGDLVARLAFPEDFDGAPPRVAQGQYTVNWVRFDDEAAGGGKEYLARYQLDVLPKRRG